MLRAIDSDSVADMNTYYFGPFVHEGPDGGSTSLKYILTPEGRILNKGTDTSPIWDWEYYLKDHLGNVRVVIAPTENAGYSAVQQETHYYPYGMRMSQLSNSANSTNDWLFSSKQLESNFDLGWYSFGARNNYDPALIIWRSMDPMAEKYYSLSPFSYCANNPIIYIDLEGKDIFYTNGLEIVDVKRTSDNFHTVVQDGTGEIWFKTSDLKVSLKIKDQTTFQLGLVFAGMLKGSPYESIWREKYNVEGFDWGEIDIEAEYLNREFRQNTSDDNARLRLFKLISEYIEKLWKLYQKENDNDQNQQQNENNNTTEQDEDNIPDQEPEEEDKDAN
ncbi:MAG: hypothetical protein K9H26_06790 [Prolixibacteraceae bacterium]|nr:hypothetical protein [Prolixibacteraceae bacterium]